MKYSIVLIICVLLFGLNPTQAQESIDPLLKLSGTWKGSGHQQMPDGERQEFNQTEEVSALLGGKLVKFQGTGTDKDSGKVGFGAVGIAFTDPSDGFTYIDAWTMDGNYVKARIHITDQGFQWSFKAGNGTVRYTATIGETTWKEVGEYTPDGQTYYPFLEMNLERVGH